jgi:hypothetical protein
MSTVEEKQAELNATVESLGTAKFGLENDTVSVAAILASPDKYQLLDSRSADEMAVGTIPGAITRAAFEADPSKCRQCEVLL